MFTFKTKWFEQGLSLMFITDVKENERVLPDDTKIIGDIRPKRFVDNSSYAEGKPSDDSFYY